MGLKAREAGGKTFEPVSEACHIAVCYGVVDLGTHNNPIYHKEQRKVLIMFELPDERIDLEREGKMVNLPRAISKTYSLSLHEKAGLRKDLQAWRGKAFTPEELKGFELSHLLGVGCQIQVVHVPKGEKTYANIASLMSMPKGMPVKRKPENPTLFWSFDDWDGTRDPVPFPENMPEWVVNLCRQSTEWNSMYSAPGEDEGVAAPAEEVDDSLPF